MQVADPIMPTAKERSYKKIVLVNLAVTPGEEYRLRDIGFTGSSVFSPTVLRHTFAIEDGDVFDREKIAFGLDKLRKIFGAKGYMFFSAVPETDIEEAAHTVSLRMDLDEGPIFHAGTLTVRGEESQPGAREKLLKAWKAYEGQVYDLRTSIGFCATFTHVQ